MNETICPECESPIGSSCAECPECGAVLRLVCYSCGSDIDAGMEDCPGCSAKLVCPRCGERLDSERCENCSEEEEPEPSEQEFDIGVELMDEQEYEAAAKSFTVYLDECSKGPERDSARVNRGYCFFHLRRFHDAEIDFTAALAAAQDVQLLFYRGRSRMEQGNTEGALEDFTTVLESDPGRPAVLLYRGRTLQQAERHAEALADFDALIAADPASPDAHFSKSESLLALKRPREALSELVIARNLGSERADETLRLLAGRI